MSGPVTDADAPPLGTPRAAPADALERHEARTVDLAGIAVRRLLPKRRRRTVGAWCFVDHFGPTSGSPGMQIGPHPHIGLQTVTWLLDGEVLHRDSLGTEQAIVPGQLNLMTAGRGVAHSEESTSPTPRPLHGVQLWVAQPSSTRDGEPAFEHHAELPRIELGAGHGTVLVGTVGAVTSPARSDSPLVGVVVHAASAGDLALPLDPAHEHAVAVLDGSVTLAGQELGPGELAYVGLGRDELALVARSPAEVLVLGGEPFGEQVLMWWNFVARTRGEVEEAWQDWERGAERFGTVASPLERSPAPPLR